MEALPLAIAVWVAFVAGTVSFASPCVLPLVPSYLSFVTIPDSTGAPVCA